MSECYPRAFPEPQHSAATGSSIPSTGCHHARMAPGSSSEGRSNGRNLPPEPRSLGSGYAMMQCPGKGTKQDDICMHKTSANPFQEPQVTCALTSESIDSQFHSGCMGAAKPVHVLHYQVVCCLRADTPIWRNKRHKTSLCISNIHSVDHQ